MSGEEALDILWDALHHVRTRGGFRIPAYSDREAYEFRLDLLRHNPDDPASEVAVIQMTDLDLLLAYAAVAARYPEVERPQVYTLTEARPIILRELCAKEGGHALESTIITTVAGVACEMLVRCTRCGTQFSEDS